MRIRSVVVALGACIALSACQGLKDALTAHTDVVARTVDQQLSAQRLGDLMGKARIGIDPSKDNAQIVADLWTDYQRMGYAAAHHDTLNETAAKTIQPLIDNMRVTMMIDTLRAHMKVDTSNAEAAYNSSLGGYLGARHLLFAYPLVNGQPGTATPAQKDSVRKFANSIFPQITPGNFQAMIKKYSGDPGSKDNGGAYPPFGPRDMVPEFYNATQGLKPGEITKSLVESPYGLHVIQRLTYPEVKKTWDPQYASIAQRIADSSLSANTMAKADLQLKDNAAAQVKDAVKNMDAHQTDNSTLATFKGGDMTVGEFVKWVNIMPAQNRQQVVQMLPTMPDSQVKPFLKNMALRELLLHEADSAKLQVAPADKAALAAQFTQAVTSTWAQLNVSPSSLDSAKSVGDREKMAAARIDTLVAKIMSGEANPVGVIMPVKTALNAKWDATISQTGLTRAAELARKVKATADSARSSQPSQVPMPGGQPAPAPAPPATKTPAPTKKKP